MSHLVALTLITEILPGKTEEIGELHGSTHKTRRRAFAILFKQPSAVALRATPGARRIEGCQRVPAGPGPRVQEVRARLGLPGCERAL